MEEHIARFLYNTPFCINDGEHVNWLIVLELTHLTNISGESVKYYNPYSYESFQLNYS